MSLRTFALLLTVIFIGAYCEIAQSFGRRHQSGTFTNPDNDAQTSAQLSELLTKKPTANDEGVTKCLSQYKFKVGAGVKCQPAQPSQPMACGPYGKQLVLTPFQKAMPNVTIDSPEECASRASCCTLVAAAYDTVTDYCGCNAQAPPNFESHYQKGQGTQ